VSEVVGDEGRDVDGVGVRARHVSIGERCMKV
jgi:hypothetical protein